MSRKLLKNAATVIAYSTAWDTARTIDTLLLSERIHVPSDSYCFLLLVHGIPNVITTAKESALQAWAKKTSH